MWKLGDEVEVCFKGTISKMELNDKGEIEYIVKSDPYFQTAWASKLKDFNLYELVTPEKLEESKNG